jgi:hypothetical protein
VILVARDGTGQAFAVKAGVSVRARLRAPERSQSTQIETRSEEILSYGAEEPFPAEEPEGLW